MKLKRGFYLGISILSIFFFVISCAGIISVWVTNQPLTNTIITEIHIAQEDLDTAASSINSVQEELALLGGQIDIFQSVLDLIGEDAVQATQKVADIVIGVEEKISPLINQAEEGVNTVYDTFQSIKEILETINQLPLINIELPGGETIENLIVKIESLQSDIQDTKASVEQVADTTKALVTTLTTNFENWELFINETQSSLGGYESRIAEYQELLSNLERRLPQWIDIASVLITILLLWMVFSQIGLFLLAWSVYKDEDLIARLRVQKNNHQ